MGSWGRRMERRDFLSLCAVAGVSAATPALEAQEAQPMAGRALIVATEQARVYSQGRGKALTVVHGELGAAHGAAGLPLIVCRGRSVCSDARAGSSGGSAYGGHTDDRHTRSGARVQPGAGRSAHPGGWGAFRWGLVVGPVPRRSRLYDLAPLPLSAGRKVLRARWGALDLSRRQMARPGGRNVRGSAPRR